MKVQIGIETLIGKKMATYPMEDVPPFIVMIVTEITTDLMIEMIGIMTDLVIEMIGIKDAILEKEAHQ
mgnify:CR=1 FL=1